MANVLAFMTAWQVFVTDVVAFRHHSSADNRRLEEGQTARTGLRLTVDDRTLLAKTHMTCLSALMFFAVEHLVAGLIAGMVVEDGRDSELATDIVAEMLAACSLLLADEFALEVLFISAPAFDLPALQSAHAHLVNHHFALRAGALVAASWADVAAV